MKIVELLDGMRRPYLDELSSVADEHEYHIEPVLRLSDGQAARDGMFGTPCRYDFVRKDTGEVCSIETAQRMELAPIRLELDGKLLDISTFSWDWLTLDIAGLSADMARTPIQNWFMRWFDEDDTNPQNAESLYGVVHFMSDAKQIDGGVRFCIDLGSAPASAVAELIEELLSQGAEGLALRG
ncbi:hypothetical protein MJ904_22445 [Massilia sp. MB5]|uniref:hypothetical protein n=1 Tax=Massilia sp. MB5 TaxID=2919578 RepID=UPI001F0D1CD8|nr:hypothetical protein [Massilia sp. MB5]UMR29769.1 hypothetical protein MJ904_22445 [Massilia sp. MB5]